MILFVGFGMIRNGLMFHGQQFFSVVNGAVSVVVVAYSAVEHVIAENTVEGLSLGRRGLLRFCEYFHSWRRGGRARSRELPVDLYHAGIARLDRSKLRVIADLRNLYARSIDDIDQAFAARCLLNYSIDGYA
jgi:hypothetical protein